MSEEVKTYVAVEICCTGEDHVGICRPENFINIGPKYVTKFKYISIPESSFVNGVLPKELYPTDLADREERMCSLMKKGGFAMGHDNPPARYYRTMKVRLVTQEDLDNFTLNDVIKAEKETERKLREKFKVNVDNINQQISNTLSQYFTEAPVGRYSLALNLGITGPVGNSIQTDFTVEEPTLS